MAAMDDELLAHHIATLKRAAGVGQSVNPYLDRMRAIIRRRVSGFDAERRTAARLQTLIEKLAKELDVPAQEWIKSLKIDLKEFAKYEAAYQAETIGGWVGIELTAPTMTQVWAAAKFEPVATGATKTVDFEKLIDDWGMDEVSRLAMGVKNGFIQGLTVTQIIKDVVGAGGLSDVSLREAKGVAHDSLMHVAGVARFETYRENDDVIQGYSLVITLDGKTSAICRAWDEEKVYKFTDSYQPRPPFHRWCRTTTRPALSKKYDFLEEGATRAARGADGGQKVAADTTYYDFLKRQPAAFQDQVLGKTKGQIFRNAGLTPEEFRKITVDDLGRPLTIEQMAERDKQVAEYLRKKG